MSEQISTAEPGTPEHSAEVQKVYEAEQKKMELEETEHPVIDLTNPVEKPKPAPRKPEPKNEPKKDSGISPVVVGLVVLAVIALVCFLIYKNQQKITTNV